jgi:hypothetical protein
VARRGQKSNIYRVQVRIYGVACHLEGASLEDRIILKWVLRSGIVVCGVGPAGSG